MSKNIPLILLSITGLLFFIPTFVTVVLAPLYIFAAILLTLIFNKLKYLQNFSEKVIALSLTLLPEIVFLCFVVAWLFNGNQIGKVAIILFIVTQIMLVITYLAVGRFYQYLSTKNKNDNAPWKN